MGARKGKRDGVSLAFGIAVPQWEACTAQWAISSMVEHNSDNCVVVPGL